MIKRWSTNIITIINRKMDYLKKALALNGKSGDSGTGLSLRHTQNNILYIQCNQISLHNDKKEGSVQKRVDLQDKLCQCKIIYTHCRLYTSDGNKDPDFTVMHIYIYTYTYIYMAFFITWHFPLHSCLEHHSNVLLHPADCAPRIHFN